MNAPQTVADQTRETRFVEMVFADLASHYGIQHDALEMVAVNGGGQPEPTDQE